MATRPYIVIDFDSTFSQVEALEELADIVLNGSPQRQAVLEQIKSITNLGVDGSISFYESLSQRLSLMKIHRSHLAQLVRRLKKKVSTSFSRNKTFFKTYAGHIYIVSAGFKEFIDPVVADFAIDGAHVLANTFVFDEEGYIIGFDEENPLAHTRGKSKVLSHLNLPGEVHVIGDAWTDYEIKEAGFAHKFFAFTENVLRENILPIADHVAPSFDEFLYINRMPMTISYPKNRIRVLLLEGVHPRAVQLLNEEGYQVELVMGALSEDELCERIKGVSILGIRSKTQVTARVLANANRLMAIGAFCIGTNQIDLQTCTEKGIAVFNAPYSNTRSVVELAIGEIIMLMRRVPALNEGMHQGKWDKSARNSYEIRGKKLGIVGYGNIGSQLSVLAEAMGMDVFYYDVVERLALGKATKCATLKELLKKADVVSLHVDGRKENARLFDASAFKMMKPGAILINLSRGHVVDIDALAKALKSGRLLGAAIDVFPYEPKNNDEPFVSELAKLDNVILTPHVGGSTAEAQQNIGEYVPGRIIDYINSGSTYGSVNLPELQLPALRNAHRLIHTHENVPGIMARINSVLAGHGINIVGQYLKTNERIGYVITDINKTYDNNVLEDLKRVEHTIKFRLLY